MTNRAGQRPIRKQSKDKKEKVTYMKEMKEKEISAGLLLYRRRPELEVFIAHMGGPFFEQKDAGGWSIPKGLVNDGEDLLTAASREFMEETGFKPNGPCHSLGSVTMKNGKTIHIWACEAPPETEIVLKSNTFELEWPKGSGQKQHFPEMDKGAWFSPTAAVEKLVPAQREFVTRLAALVAQS
jgi:predicted NUDIX family NTP pyrophosphohydrolase